MDLSKYDWTAVLKSVGQVATAFNPAVGSGLVVASQVLETINKDSVLSSNEALENNVIGLGRCKEILQDCVQKIELNQQIDTDSLKLVIASLGALSELSNKTFLILK